MSPALIAAVVGLLLLHAGLATSSYLQLSLAYDEAPHLLRGVTAWRTGSFGQYPHTSTADLWMAIPAAASDSVELPDMPPSYPEADAFESIKPFMFEMGNDPAMLRWAGRFMMVLLSVAMGLLVFCWSRRLFGVAGGLISLTLYALSPTVLAHAPLMNADTALALLLVAGAGALWRMMRHVTPITVAISGVLAGLVLVTKVSGVVIIPIALLLGLVRLCWRAPMRVSLLPGRTQYVQPTWAKAGMIVGLAGAHVLIGAAVIWLFYGLQYDAVAGDYSSPTEGGSSTPGIAFFARYRLLPEAFLVTYDMYAEVTSAREAFLLGQYSVVGWWYFFPVAFAVKTSLGVWGGALLALWRGWLEVWGGRYRSSRLRRRRLQVALLRTAPLWLVIVCYLALAMSASLNIGHRHILPIYVAMFILMGVLGKGLRRRRKGGATLAAWRARPLAMVCLVVLAVESLTIWPSYLTFFNLAAGGPSNGYRLLVDSSLDWGQDLPKLRDWLDREGLNGDQGAGGSGRDQPPVYLAYFGSDRPSAFGIHARDLLEGERATPAPTWQPGVYIVSANYLQSVYVGPPGAWQTLDEQRYQSLLPYEAALIQDGSDAARAALVGRVGPREAAMLALEFHVQRIGRLMAYLDGRTPDARIGHTMFVFHLSEADLQAALYGPVPTVEHRPRGIERFIP